MSVYMSEMAWIRQFSDILKEQLKYNDMSQRDLADQACISEAAISSYICMQRMPSVRSIINICWVLGIPVDDLINYGKKIE